jgi:hypothetical protein
VTFADGDTEQERGKRRGWPGHAVRHGTGKVKHYWHSRLGGVVIKPEFGDGHAGPLV